MKHRQVLAQGEVYIEEVESVPEGLKAYGEANSGGQIIIAHSESGHHHVLERPATVYRDKGMNRFYAIVDEVNALVQDAPDAHQTQPLRRGIYRFTIAREYDPFSQENRVVAD